MFLATVIGIIRLLVLPPPPIELWCRFSKNAMYGCIIDKVKYFSRPYTLLDRFDKVMLCSSRQLTPV